MNIMLWLFLFFLAPEPVTGKWKVSGEVAGNQVTPVCTLQQTGTDLSGECSADGASSKLTGKVEDTKLTWEYTINYQGQNYTLVYKGTMKEAGKIAGNIEVRDTDVGGPFTATKE